jgi:hypothetical protein
MVILRAARGGWAPANGDVCGFVAVGRWLDLLQCKTLPSCGAN